MTYVFELYYMRGGLVLIYGPKENVYTHKTHVYKKFRDISRHRVTFREKIHKTRG